VAACRACSGAPVVLGGAGYSIFPRPALAYLGADFGIRGDGEAAFPALLDCLASAGIRAASRGCTRPAGTWTGAARPRRTWTACRSGTRR